MALIGTLRDKMGILLVIFIFVALAAFILGELLTNNSVLLNQNELGEINAVHLPRQADSRLRTEGLAGLTTELNAVRAGQEAA